MKKLFRSFKLRMFLIIFLTGTISVVIFNRGLIKSYVSNAEAVREAEMTNQMQILADHLINYNYIQNNTQDIINAEIRQFANVYNGRVIVVDSNFKVIQDTNDISLGKYLIAKEVINAFKGKTTANIDNKNRYYEIAIPISTKDAIANEESGIQGVLIASSAMTSIDSNSDYIKRVGRYIEIALICVIIAVAIAAAVLMTRPISRISADINQVVSFEDAKLVESSYNETEEIVDAFNKLQARLKVLDDSRQDFVSNVSHELKTPITSVKVLADSLIAQDDVPIEVYREFMEDIAQEIDRENAIITDLLAMVNMEKGRSVLNITTVNVNEMLEILIKRLGPIARMSEVDLILESRRQVQASIDEAKMMQALTNLVENAIKYNRRNGWVKVVLDADHQFMTIEISDCGIGIPEESLDHIFERFYRVDKSHSKEIGGTGLGLSISRKIVLLHRGSIKAESVIDEGTMFTVRVPLTYITD